MMNAFQANLKKTVIALALPLMMSAPGLSSAASIQGDGLTASVAIVGDRTAPVGLLGFSIDASSNGKPGTFAYQLIFSNPVSDLISGLNQLTSTQSTVRCVSVDEDGDTGWFSAAVTFATPDFRANNATQEQTAALIDAGLEIVYGRVSDGDHQTRSLFILSSTAPVVSLQDAGGLGSTSTSLTNQLNVNNFCRTQDNMLNGNADYIQLNTINNGSSTDCCTPDKAGCVITITKKGTDATAKLNGRTVDLCDINYLAPDDETPVGGPLPNVPSTFAPQNIPALSLYSNAEITRSFQAGHVNISK